MTPRTLIIICSAWLVPLLDICLGAGDTPVSKKTSDVTGEAQGDDFLDILSDEHAREELGVNVFTAPSIARLLKDLENLRPIPYTKIRRPVPGKISTDRPTIALTMGVLIAQGFALVDAEKISDLEDLARGLLRHARGLSVLEAVLPRASSLIELGSSGNWADLKSELSAAQTDAEQAMIELRDEEIAHLVSVGGWIRGLEITSHTIMENYSPERAELLRKIELLDYFLDRLSTLHPEISQRKVIQTLIAESQRIRAIIDKPPGDLLTREDVVNINAHARTAVDALIGPRKAR